MSEVEVLVEMSDAEYEFFANVAEERGRSVEEEIVANLCALCRDPDYLQYIEDRIRRDLEGEEWKYQDG